jgi:hypothetical protein
MLKYKIGLRVGIIANINMVLPRLLRQMRSSFCMPYLSFEHYSSQARVVLYFKYHSHWEHGIKLSASKKLAVEGRVKSTLSVVPLYLPVTVLRYTTLRHVPRTASTW